MVEVAPILAVSERLLSVEPLRLDVGPPLAGQRLSPPREYLAQFAMVKATRKQEAPNQKNPIMETSTAISLASRRTRESS